MLIDKINNLFEVITKEEFHILLNDLILEQNSISDEDLINCLDILGEKFGKFYSLENLTIGECDFLYKTLIRLSDFDNYERTADLTGLLFSFRIDDYYFYLKEVVNKKNLLNNVKTELTETLEEYKRK